MNLSFFLILCFLVGKNFAFDQNKVTFWLYKGEKSTQVTSENVTDLLDSSLRSVFVVHGWKQSVQEEFIVNMSIAYSQHKKVNLLAVDWKDLAASVWYLPSYLSVEDVGRVTGEFLYNISKKVDAFQPADLHLIGHSLGAHVAGFAAKFLQKATQSLIGRITALEAAGPLFTFPILIPRKFRLAKSDAKFVDFWHTNSFIFGTGIPLGHADFYINKGGPIQPTCWKNFVTVFFGDRNPFYCSHELSNKYYTNTIKGQNYDGFKWHFCGSKVICKATAQMGENADPETRGIYWVKI